MTHLSMRSYQRSQRSWFVLFLSLSVEWPRGVVRLMSYLYSGLTSGVTAPASLGHAYDNVPQQDTVGEEKKNALKGLQN